jgi:two-component system sensor histidine kinase KdpD
MALVRPLPTAYPVRGFLLTRWYGAWPAYLVTTAGVALMSGLIALIHARSEWSNISLLYLLVVIGAALYLGRGPAIAAAVLAFLAYNYFFEPPIFAFVVNEPGQVLTLAMFLATAVSIGNLTAALNQRAEEARRIGREATALAATSCAVSSQLDLRRSLEEILEQVASVTPVRRAAVLRRGPGEEQTAAAIWPPDAIWAGVSESRRFPLVANERVLGELCLEYLPAETAAVENSSTLSSLANLAAVALERDRLIRTEAEVKALQETDRLKTALLSMVSHDFRSPLTSIKASAGAFLQDPDAWDSVTLRELHTGIVREADRLNDVIGNILTMSRVDAGAWKPVCERTSIWEIVEVARVGLPETQDRRLHVDFQPELPEVLVDPVQISHVLRNLLDNALKYSPPGSRVEVRASVEGPSLVVRVLDRGPGLPEGDEDRIWERFYRAPALRESSIPGAGLGLSVCHGLVVAHGGTIEAWNREEGGAVFSVGLPLAEEE